MSTVIEPTTVDLTPPEATRPSGQGTSHPQGRPTRRRRKFRRGGWWLLAGLVAVGLLSAGTSRVLRHMNRPQQQLVYFTVNRGNLSIDVIERGNLESQFNESVICEVDDINGDGIDGTPIIWIVANGSSVKKGDLLVELDSASHRERLDSQVLDYEHAKAAQVQAEVKFENQKSLNETAVADGMLQVKLANLEREMFQDEENGSFQLEIEEIERLIDDINNEILAASASKELKKNEMDGLESLFKLGYAGKSEVDRTRLDFLQAEGEFAAKLNRLQTQMATLEKKKVYERQMQELQLKGNVETAIRNLEQVRRNNTAELAQADAALSAANEALKKEKERLDRYEEQLEKCKIYAPQDGMVAYENSSSRYSRNTQIGPGALLRERQPILSLPNLSHMQVKTSVHESVQNQIDAGLSATIRLDAFPDRAYEGTVKSVAVLPQQTWMNDTKMYETVVTIDDEVSELKPGMTAVVEIHVDVLRDVLSVPVQAVVQIRGDNWCYVDVDGAAERRQVQLGQTNDKFVEILEGLVEGDRVVLNPMAIVDQGRDTPGVPASGDESEPNDIDQPADI